MSPDRFDAERIATPLDVTGAHIEAAGAFVSIVVVGAPRLVAEAVDHVRGLGRRR